jgi:Arc/MetJ-type ribon-helix-helix transcriptional regulator
MPSESERISVRLSKETIQKIEELLSTGKYGKTISDFVRKAIDYYIETETAPENLEKKVVELPKESIEVLEEDTKKGRYISVDDAIRDVIRQYVRKRLEESDR